jgi:predicted anti-sigma-YlaC factor YlaD
MNAKLTNFDPHERAQMMIASAEEASVAGESSDADQSWLAAHLESCPPCREFQENSRETIRALRGIPITATSGLISATQIRVRQRALELQRQQERLWVVCICCAAVTISTVISTAFLWRGFEWMGQHARLSSPVWEGGFVVFYLLPAVFIGIVLLARGTFLADHNGSYHD